MQKMKLILQNSNSIIDLKGKKEENHFFAQNKFNFAGKKTQKQT